MRINRGFVKAGKDMAKLSLSRFQARTEFASK